MYKKISSYAVAVLLSLLLVAGSCWPAASAYATTATQDLNAEADEAQRQVEESAAEYDTAVAKLEGLQKDIEQNAARINEIEEQLPGQRERSSQAYRALYKMQHQGFTILDMLLSSGSLTDFIVSLDYINYLQQSNIDQITRLQTMQDELENTEADLRTKQIEAQAEKDRAEASLSEARKARQAAQEKALAEAKAMAEAEAAAQAAAAAAEAAAQPEQTAPTTPAPSTPIVETPSDVDWSSDKQVFVEMWGKRIDAYLAGSPLAGQGRTFAIASWDYAVDPRWSPAISNTESSKGRHCFLPHNAWGWGQISWSSWEEAIDAHVRGLARGYGHTITVENAKKYCPPNWEHWYKSTLAEMESI